MFLSSFAYFEDKSDQWETEFCAGLAANLIGQNMLLKQHVGAQSAYVSLVVCSSNLPRDSFMDQINCKQFSAALSFH